MKKLAALLFALLMTMAACRVNEGDIGVLYGIWMVESMETPGSDDIFIIEEYSFRFQGERVQLTINKDHHQYRVYTGKWSRQGDAITINFEGSTLPKPFTMLSDRSMPMAIKQETSTRLVLESPSLILRLRKLR